LFVLRHRGERQGQNDGGRQNRFNKNHFSLVPVF
jgi:hypothetical protein